MMDKLEKQLQQRADLLELHCQEWSETLIVETEMQHFLEGQQRQKILQFANLDLSPSTTDEWATLMEQQSQERDEFVKSNAIKRQHIHDRHEQEKLELTTLDKI
jgi:hypothetical protein